MKTKSRDYRKLERARRRWTKALEEAGNGYTKKLFFSDLHMKRIARWFYKKHHVPLPIITFIYKH